MTVENIVYAAGFLLGLHDLSLMIQAAIAAPLITRLALK